MGADSGAADSGGAGSSSGGGRGFRIPSSAPKHKPRSEPVPRLRGMDLSQFLEAAGVGSGGADDSNSGAAGAAARCRRAPIGRERQPRVRVSELGLSDVGRFREAGLVQFPRGLDGVRWLVVDLALLFGWLGILIGGASLAASLVLHRTGDPSPRAVYVVTGQMVARSRPEAGIGITYKGEPVDAVHQMVVVLWNAGKGVIRADDVPSHNPIQVTLPTDARVLSADVWKTSADVIQFTLELADDRRSALLGFHHLGQRDGAAVRLLFEGEFVRPRVTGTVLGTRSGSLEEVRTPLWDDVGGWKPQFAVAVASGLASLALGTGAVVSSSAPLAWWGFGIACFGVFFSFLARSGYRQDVRFIPEAIRPEPFNRFQVPRLLGQGE